MVGLARKWKHAVVLDYMNSTKCDSNGSEKSDVSKCNRLFVQPNSSDSFVLTQMKWNLATLELRIYLDEHTEYSYTYATNNIWNAS